MSRQDDLPPAIMEAAIRWSVTLASGTADAGHRRDYQRWLEADERHRRAAERLAAIDDEVSDLMMELASAARLSNHSTLIGTYSSAFK